MTPSKEEHMTDVVALVISIAALCFSFLAYSDSRKGRVYHD